MKKIIFLVASLAMTFMLSCSKDNEDIPVTEPYIPNRVGFYALSEGTMNKADSKLAYFDFATQTLNPDYFQDKNNEPLGDTANDMIIYGSKLYIVVNVSNKIVVIDNTTGKKVANIELGKAEGDVDVQPRYAASANGKVFVSTYNKGVAVIDTTTLKVNNFIQLSEKFSENIIERDGKIYVANSGSNSASFGGDGTTISVISVLDQKEIETIKVPANPNRLDFDKDGNLYVATWGDWSKIDAQISKINLKTKEVTPLKDVIGSRFVIANDYIYSYHFSYISYKFHILKTKISTGEVTTVMAKSKDYGLKSIYDVVWDPVGKYIYYLDESGTVAAFSENFDEAKNSGHFLVFKGMATRVNSLVFRYI